MSRGPVTRVQAGRSAPLRPRHIDAFDAAVGQSVAQGASSSPWGDDLVRDYAGLPLVSASGMGLPTRMIHGWVRRLDETGRGRRVANRRPPITIAFETPATTGPPVVHGRKYLALDGS